MGIVEFVGFALASLVVPDLWGVLDFDFGVCLVFFVSCLNRCSLFLGWWALLLSLWCLLLAWACEFRFLQAVVMREFSVFCCTLDVWVLCYGFRDLPVALVYWLVC